MAAMPSYQFYTKKPPLMDSLQSSVSKFNAGTSLQLFRSGSSIPLTNHCFRAILGSRYADSTPHRNSHKQFNRLLGKKKGGGNFHVGEPISRPGSNKIESRNSWLDNWDLTPKPGGGKTPQAVVNYRNKGDISGSDAEEGTSTSTRGSTMERIVEKLKKFGYIDDVSEKNEESRGMMEDLFHVEEGLLPNTRGGFSEEFPFGDKSVVARSNGKVRFPWEKNEQRPSLDSRSNRSLAKLTLPELEINRLTNMALRMKNKTKIGAAGVTQQVVEMIQEKWKSSEVVRLKIEGPPALNMRRVHETLERKTGGLVVWRSGTSVALYRGAAYEDPAQNLKKKAFRKNELPKKIPDKSGQESPNSGHLSQTDPHKAKVVRTESSDLKPEESSEVKYEDEIDELLNSLGPRYEDWPGDGPLPVDADLLPGIVSGYQPPFRLLPYGVRPSLGVKDATALRRLARVLPPHFAVGRSRQHQGLAAAIVKLWERSSIAKIALKRGVQLTTSERMAEDLKRLTGGMLLSRNKDFLVYYRGKNFLSPDVAEALLEKERLAKVLQDEEERARLRASTLVIPSEEDTVEFGTAGTLKETLDADSKWGKRLDDEYKEKVMREAEVLRHADIVRKLERKLSFALRKLTKAERVLSKVEEFLTPADPSEDPESLTDEERFMFRKLGLRMKAFLLLGRRGVFGGTVENMHLHWKYRELVKIIVKAPNIEEVKSIALALEAESGGVLVSVDKISKGYAIIVFRGRHYERPPLLRPKNLLTKRKALARSIELQRRQDIMNHVSTLQTRVNQLRSEIEQVAAIKDQGDEELYSRLDSAYSTEDDDSEEEGDDAYLKYESENDTVEENIEPVHYANPETDNDMADPDFDTVHSTYQETYFSCGTHPEPETEFAEP